MRWAIVIGIDEYGGEIPSLSAAVTDAESFHEWVVSDTGANVPKENVRLLVGRVSDPSQPGGEEASNPTKDNIMRAINDVMKESSGIGDAFFFYFSGHGITSTYANREESAIAAADFDERHPERTLAVRSITEFFETTQFKDQFFFIDACRVKPRTMESEIGGWTIPRTREPGQLPVQQFILYATAPGQEAMEIGWAGEAAGAFSSVLVPALRGEGRAKAWSWDANRYEIRWERLADYVKDRMERNRQSPDGELRWVQVPQDAGCRGVLDRDRDARLASLSGRGAPLVKLKVNLNAEGQQELDLVVLNGVGDSVATAFRVTGSEYTFALPPRTYAVRATTAEGRTGRLPVPVELYDDADDDGSTGEPLAIDWSADEDEGEGDGEITIVSPDPLAVAEVRDQTGRYIGLSTRASACFAPRGLYRLRELGPEPRSTGADQSVVVRAGKQQLVDLPALKADPYVGALAKALGGSCDEGHVIPVAGAEPVGWAQPSTVIAAGLGAVLRNEHAFEGVGLESRRVKLEGHETGVALYAVTRDGDSEELRGWSARMWAAGDPVPLKDEIRPFAPTDAGVAANVWPVEEPGPHWLSIEAGDSAEPTVVALPVLRGRLATVVAQLEPGRVRLYQFHPLTKPDSSNEPDRLRRAEHLQRLLLSGRLDGVESLATEVAGNARDDPVAGCLAGYVLLRLGSFTLLKELASTIVEVAPKLSDAFILRGEYEAFHANLEARNQAFADAVGTGVPAFAEGLTRLVEGLRASGFFHPRGALVRYIFQRHARGSMWSAFTPRSKFEEGRLVITGADVGYEG